MKNVNKHFIFGAFLIGLLLISCTTTSLATDIPYDVAVTSENDSNFVSITAEPIYGSSTILFDNYKGLRGIELSIVNNTDKSVRIIWSESSISYGENSYSIFLEGQKFIDANTPASPTNIPAKGKLVKETFSANQPYYDGGWTMNLISGSPTIILAVESNGTRDYYTVKFTPRPVL